MPDYLCNAGHALQRQANPPKVTEMKHTGCASLCSREWLTGLMFSGEPTCPDCRRALKLDGKKKRKPRRMKKRRKPRKL